MKRTVIPELLDDDYGTAAEVASSLADLGRINRWFGGVRVLSRLVERVAERAGRRELTLLDVAGARGELPARAAASLGQRSIRLTTTEPPPRLPVRWPTWDASTAGSAECACSPVWWSGWRSGPDRVS